MEKKVAGGNKKEIWKPIKNYENNYEISNKGKIRSIKRLVSHWRGGKRTLKSKKMKQSLDKTGYLHINLCKKGIKKRFTVHSLVMRSFIGNYPKGKEINHKDGNKTNCFLSNLEYITKSENRIHGLKNGLIKISITSKLTKKEVLSIRNIYSGKLLSQNNLAKIFKVSPSNIGRIIRNETWKKL